MEKWIVGRDTVYEADEINSGLAVSPWSGHRQFAYDLVNFIKPQRIVELGTHYGCSFFAFLQACKDNQLSTEVVAVDSWEGDEQAGFYGDDVISTVKETVSSKFSQQKTRLIRKYFIDALADIEDESVDILHIDGLHTYEAVTEDYTTWLCKLKPDGIILFHDIASELGYGTNTFWLEKEKEFPHHYSFQHSWGLGVLFPKGERYYEIFEQNNMQDKILIYEYMAMYKLQNKQLLDHIIMVQERDKAIKSNEKLIKAKDENIKANEEMIREKDEVIARNEEMIRERDKAIESNEKLIKAKDKNIKANEEMIREKDEVIARDEEMIRERDKAIDSNEKMIQERDTYIKQLEARLNGEE